MHALNLGTDHFFANLGTHLRELAPRVHAGINAVGDGVLLGASIALAVLLLFVAVSLAYRGRPVAGLTLVAVAALGFLAVTAVNWLIGTDRPPGIAEQGTPGRSFASPLAFLAAMAAFFLVTVVGGRLRRWRTSLALAGVCLVMVAALGFAELYLRREFLTAVLAGWTAGLLCALIGCQLAAVPVPGLMARPKSKRQTSAAEL